MSGEVLVPFELIDESPPSERMKSIPELAADINRRGLMEPISLRPKGDRYEVVHGHGRTRAVRHNGSTHILAYILGTPEEDPR